MTRTFPKGIILLSKKPSNEIKCIKDKKKIKFPRFFGRMKQTFTYSMFHLKALQTFVIYIVHKSASDLFNSLDG